MDKRGTSSTPSESLGSNHPIDAVVSAWLGSGQGSLDVAEQKRDINTRGSTSAVPWVQLSLELRQCIETEVAALSMSLRDSVVQQLKSEMSLLQSSMGQQFQKQNDILMSSMPEPKSTGQQFQHQLDSISRLLEHISHHQETIQKSIDERQQQKGATPPQTPDVAQFPSGPKHADANVANGTGGIQSHRSVTVEQLDGLAEKQQIDIRDKKDFLTSHGEILESLWELSEKDKGETEHSWYRQAYKRVVNRHKSPPLGLLHFLGLSQYFLSKCPEGLLVNIALSNRMHLVSICAVLLYSIFSMGECDYRVRLLLEDPSTDVLARMPNVYHYIDVSFIAFFCLEVLFRIAAFRTWYFVSPEEWSWNMFDVLTVGLSAFSNLSRTRVLRNSFVNVAFLRTVRLFRVFRLLKLVRVVSVFNELRKVLYAVRSCIASLFWATMFLMMTMTLFSLAIMNMIQAIPDKDDDALEALRMNFNGFGACFQTLSKVMFGSEWIEPHASLQSLGMMQSAIMPSFVIIVNLGVMNIVIGVFAEVSGRNPELALTAQDKIEDVEAFIGNMLSLAKYFTPSGDGAIHWEDFKKCFYREDVQAFLASEDLDTSHAHLIYHLSDEKHDGVVDMQDFAIGLLRLKGMAKALDSKVLCHSAHAIERNIYGLQVELEEILNGQFQQVHDKLTEYRV